MNPNTKMDQNEKHELIDQALQEAVSGGSAVLCDVWCVVCDLCGQIPICTTATR